jgi:RNA polymerase sigma factor (TIGR02999 family)
MASASSICCAVEAGPSHRRSVLYSPFPVRHAPGRPMTTASPEEITRLLVDWSHGDMSALDRLVPVVYSELHRLAQRYMRGERPDHPLQTTALVNEAYLRLVGWKEVEWKNRAHFFAVAAQIMRRILVDFARSRNYAKRGGCLRRVSLDDALLVTEAADPDLLDLDDALTRLAAVDSRKSRVVELRFFGGLNNEEIAEVLGTSPFTVIRDWNLARAWLLREMSRASNDES